MTITYPYGNSLYINVTNRCPNRCDFCVRTPRPTAFIRRICG